MHTQDKSGRRAMPGIRLVRVMAAGLVLLPYGAVLAQSARPVVPFVSATRQAVDRLAAITRPGYYKAMLVPDRRTKSVNDTSAVAAATWLCSRSAPQAGKVANALQLDGTRLDEKQVQLTWETSDAGASGTVSLEWSIAPAEGFEPVTAAPRTEATVRAVTYQTIDFNTRPDYTYYRLKQTDLTGAYTYSPIIAINGELMAMALKAFPNPGPLRDLTFRVAGLPVTGAVAVSLYDTRGRTLYQHEQTALDADQRFALPGSLTLQPGNYYLKVVAGRQQGGLSFIVQP